MGDSGNETPVDSSSNLGGTSGFENKSKSDNLRKFASGANDFAHDYKNAGGLGGLAKQKAADKFNEKKDALKDKTKNKINSALPESVQKKKAQLQGKKDDLKNKLNKPKEKVDKVKQDLNEKVFRSGVKAAVDAVTYGSGGKIADKVLDTNKGKPIIDEVRAASNPIAGLKVGTKKIVEIFKKDAIKKTIITSIPPLLSMFLIVIVVLGIVSKFNDGLSFFKGGATTGDGAGDVSKLDKKYQAFYKNVEKYGTANKEMVIAVLTGYKDNDGYSNDADNSSTVDSCTDEEINSGECFKETDESGVVTYSKSKMKKYIKKVNEAIEDSGSDVSEGSYSDPANTGSSFFRWLYTDFVGDYYSEYVDASNSSSEKKAEIIRFIYLYYKDLIGSSCTEGSTNYDTSCDFNLTKVDLLQCGTSKVMTTVSLKDYIIGVVYAEMDSAADKENAFKAQAIAAKTYILGRSGYNSSTKHISAQSCTRNQVWCDIYNGCNVYKDSEGYNSTYSKAYSGLSLGSTYKGPLDSKRLTNWSKWYDDVYSYLYLDLSKYKSSITSLSSSDETGYYDTEQVFWTKKSNEGMKYDQILAATATAGLTHSSSYSGKGIYDLGKYCSQSSGGVATMVGNYYYYSQTLSPWNTMAHGCGSGKSFQAKGCFQTSAAMIFSDLLGRDVTPKDMNDFTAANKNSSCSDGTSIYTFFSAVANKYGLGYKSISNSLSDAPQQMLNELSNGNYIIQLLDCPSKTANGLCSGVYKHAIAIVPSSKSGYVTVMDSATPSRKTLEIKATEVTGSSSPTQASFYVFSKKSASSTTGTTSSEYLVNVGSSGNFCSGY